MGSNNQIAGTQAITVDPAAVMLVAVGAVGAAVVVVAGAMVVTSMFSLIQP